MAKELILSPASGALINKLIEFTSEEISLLWGFEDEMTKLHRTLTNIQAALLVVEKKQVNNLVGNWLRDLKDVADDAENVFDEVEYEALRRKLAIQGCIPNKVRDFLSTSNNPVVFRYNMAHKIKDIKKRLDEIEREMRRFDFLGGQSTITSTYGSREERETSSIVDDSKVVGREDDKSKIIDLLINSSNKDYSVVRIFGTGGIGKTTLAQLVYSHKSVTDHFGTRMWVCVSDNAKVKEIYGNLFQSLTGERSDVSNLDSLVTKLKDKIGKMRYLMVLDDVWNDGSIIWEKMLSDLLIMGGEGSKIIMTTRSNEDIPSMMGSIYSYQVLDLTEEDCWSLFEKIAFGRGGAAKTSNLIEIGKRILKKCGGVPLAAKFLGNLMYSKRDEDEWLSIEKDEIWNLPEGEKKIIRVLKLSFDHLPPHLKQCFVYCSIFPKDATINKEKLIQLWMAEGFLHDPSRKNISLESTGNEYFNNLQQNCFFQDEQRDWLGDIKSYKMHDLVHDLAMAVVETGFSMIVGGSSIEETEIARLQHVRFLSDYELSTFPDAVYKATKLRTIVSSTPRFGMDISFSKFSYLRVLDLSNNKITEVPPSISKLKHLRYVDFSGTQLIRLPNSFTSLYNLQTLKLKCCFHLKELPKDLRKLINLRYLIITKCYELTQLPREVGQLSQIRKLSDFFVGKENGFGIIELKDLEFLGGKLEIHNLENVKEETDAKGANLKEKKNIRQIELYWELDVFRNGNDHNDFAVLEGLQPHKDLKKLEIHNFVAMKFPTWVIDAHSCLPNLVSVALNNCNKCTHLPTLGQLSFLEFLYIEKMNAVESIGNEFYFRNEAAAMRIEERNISFPSLKELTIDEMDKLEEWSEELSCSPGFRCLESLEIKNCLKLRITPTHFPSLQKLLFRNSNSVPLSSVLTSNLTSLTSIEITECTELISLPQALFLDNPIIKYLTVIGCHKFEGFVPNNRNQVMERLSKSSLVELVLYKCDALKEVPNLRDLNSLEILVIRQCKSLKSLPDGIQYLMGRSLWKLVGIQRGWSTFHSLSSEKNQRERRK